MSKYYILYQKPDTISIPQTGICLKYLFLAKKMSVFTYSFAVLIKLGDFHYKKGLKGDQILSKSPLRGLWSPKGDLINHAEY